MMQYKISIIIPCYSVGIELLEEAIESVKKQTYSNWEIIFVDDCSPLQEWRSEKLNSIPKEKLKIIKNQENLYAGESRNIGFKHSTGDIILFLDADDKYTSNTFFDYLISKFKDNPDLDLITYEWYIDKKCKKDLKINNVLENYFPKALMRDYTTKFWFISPCLQAMKKKFLEKNNIEFLNNRNNCEDWIYCYQIFISQPNVLSTNAIFYFYRKRLNSTTYMLAKSSRFSDIDSINEICKDIIRLKNHQGGGLDLLSNESDLWFLLGPLMNSIFAHGVKKNNKKLLYIKIDKQLKNIMWDCFRQCDWKYLKSLRRYKLEWVYILAHKIYKMWRLIKR